MSLKQLVATMVVATLACWLAWVMVLYQVDPFADGAIGLTLFYLSLFLALLGSFFLISFGFRKAYAKYDLDYKIVGTSFRQSFFLALMAILILFLQSHNFLTWWNAVLIVLVLTLIEGFSLSLRKKL